MVVANRLRTVGIILFAITLLSACSPPEPPVMTIVPGGPNVVWMFNTKSRELIRCGVAEVVGLNCERLVIAP
jgi:hypothetical protein